MEELENAELEQDGDEDYYLVVPECEPFYNSFIISSFLLTDYCL